jgi:oxygen-dependent protoporphyrinogen oxidase
MKFAVIGGGISGLTSAYRLAQRGATVKVFEEAPRLGGKIFTLNDWHASLEGGPDAFLTRTPNIMNLVNELGIADELIAPSAGRALLYRGGKVRGFPPGLALGAPTSPRQMLEVELLSPIERLVGYLAMRTSHLRPSRSDDLGLRASRAFSRRYAEVVLDPLIGGINAGTIFGTSLAVAAPQLKGLIEGTSASSKDPSPAQPSSPFASHPRGLSTIIERLESALLENGASLLPGTPVTMIERGPQGWRVKALGKRVERFDGIVLATPAYASTQLLEEAVPEIAELLRSIRYSSVSVAVLRTKRLQLSFDESYSGVLVSRSEGAMSTAITLADAKWPHWADNEHSVLRISTGNINDRRHLGFRDDVLIATLRAEAEEILATKITLDDAKVVRWQNSFPQFAPYHTDLIKRVHDTLERTPGLALIGAYVAGSGIPTCVRVAEEAVTRLLGER